MLLLYKMHLHLALTEGTTVIQQVLFLKWESLGTVTGCSKMIKLMPKYTHWVPISILYLWVPMRIHWWKLPMGTWPMGISTHEGGPFKDLGLSLDIRIPIGMDLSIPMSALMDSPTCAFLLFGLCISSLIAAKNSQQSFQPPQKPVTSSGHCCHRHCILLPLICHLWSHVTVGHFTWCGQTVVTYHVIMGHLYYK